MPYFTKGPAAVQLYLLYALKTAGTELTEDRLYKCAYQSKITDWFGFTEALEAVLRSGYAVEVPRPFGQSLLPTELGLRALDSLEETLEDSSKKRLSAYINTHRRDFMSDRQFAAKDTPLEEGGEMLSLTALEGDRVLLGINLSLSSGEQALCMKSRWEKNASAIYNYIFDTLLKNE